MRKLTLKGGKYFVTFFLLLPYFANANPISDKAYQEYQTKMIFDKVFLVLASENNLSPTSMMGHSFLKISGKGFENAFSYFAVLDSGILSYFNAIIGNLDGVYLVSPYQQKATEYLHIEKRSLWEFEIDLSEAEREKLKEEIWQLKTKKDKYGFVAHNCNNALMNLLEKSNPKLKRKSLKLWTTPLEYAQYLYAIGKIKSISYIPSTDKKDLPVKNILNAKPSSRLDISADKETAFIEFSPVYQDIRTISTAYNNEMETKMFSILLSIDDKVSLPQFDVLKLKSINKTTTSFHLGFEDDFSKMLLTFGYGLGKTYKNASFYALPQTGIRNDKGFIGLEMGIISQYQDKAKLIASYELATDDKKSKIYAGFSVSKHHEIYTEFQRICKTDTLKIGVAWLF